MATTKTPTRQPTAAATSKGKAVLTIAPIPSPSRQPIIAPTIAPSVIPTEEPTLVPTIAPSVIPTKEPTLVPTIAPSVIPTEEPTLVPTIAPSVIPTKEPTLAPTTSPSVGPTLVPTALINHTPTRHIRTRSSKHTKTPTVNPTLFPTLKAANINVKQRVNNIYMAHNLFLKNNRAIEDMMNSLLVIPNPTRDDITSLMNSLNNYKNGLGADMLWLFIPIDHVLQALENTEKVEQVGLTEIASNFHTECLMGGDNHVVTINSAFGYGNVSNVIRNGPDDITGVIGNQTLSAITLVNVTTNVAGSISAMFTSLNTALSSAVGSIFSSRLASGVTVSSCDNANNINSLIYQTSNPASIADHINGFVACSAWSSKHDSHYITKSTGADCVYVPSGAHALSVCQQYLAIQHDEL